jgi:hypothetical protein
MSLGHLSKGMVHHIAADIAAVQRIDAVPRILEIVCRSAIKPRAGGAATGAVFFIGGATGIATPGRSYQVACRHPFQAVSRLWEPDADR